jgi:hypothetical protein
LWHKNKHKERGWKMTRLATTEHPYYPNEWLSVHKARLFLATFGIESHVTKKWCKDNQVEVSSTGHMRVQDLQLFVARWKYDKETAQF